MIFFIILYYVEKITGFREIVAILSIVFSSQTNFESKVVHILNFLSKMCMNIIADSTHSVGKIFPEKQNHMAYVASLYFVRSL